MALLLLWCLSHGGAPPAMAQICKGGGGSTGGNPPAVVPLRLRSKSSRVEGDLAVVPLRLWRLSAGGGKSSSGAPPDMVPMQVQHSSYWPPTHFGSYAWPLPLQRWRHDKGHWWQPQEGELCGGHVGSGWAALFCVF